MGVGAMPTGTRRIVDSPIVSQVRKCFIVEERIVEERYAPILAGELNGIEASRGCDANCVLNASLMRGVQLVKAVDVKVASIADSLVRY